MKEEKQLQILLDETKFSQVESLISEFCKKHRVYDEYYGVISRALDIVFNKINAQNPEYTQSLDVRYEFDGKSLSFIIEGQPSLNVMFDTDGEKKEVETLKLLTSDIDFPDTNILKMTFKLNAIHQQEWVRRNNLVHGYYYKTRKHV